MPIRLGTKVFLVGFEAAAQQPPRTKFQTLFFRVCEDRLLATLDAILQTNQLQVRQVVFLFLELSEPSVIDQEGLSVVLHAQKFNYSLRRQAYLQSATSSTTVVAGGVRWHWGDVFDSSDLDFWVSEGYRRFWPGL
jgi:hypothetical protein